MRVARLAALLAVLAVAGTAHASAADPGAPTGLHGFLLRADEPTTTSFHRTPSFAWDPVPGAVGYQFQLATSSTFRDNGILFDDTTLRTPVAAPPLTLPWITGSPHALYARVRALTGATTTAWSDSFGFDITPPPPPTPLSSYPGLLRWTPIEGADAYEVWLIDTNKIETVRTNVIDEREFYTFHQAPAWTATVRWRVRALRGDVFNYRINGFPVTPRGPWSPIYSSSNPVQTNGPISLTGTVSDVVSNGSSSSSAHELMPGFVWSGNQTQAGVAGELFRVYVFTDSQCLNRVFTSAVIGSPAYAPRLSGPLGLPSSSASLSAARGGYLGDGPESNDLMYDYTQVQPTEQLSPATPTTLVPGETPAAPGTSPPVGANPTAPSGSGSSGSTPAPSGSGSSAISVGGNVGPPVDLWDTNWPESGYYWTVVPVQAVGLGNTSAVASPGAAKGSTTIPVTSTTGFRIGSSITIGVAPNLDTVQIVGIGSGSITVGSALGFGHGVGDPVALATSSVLYQDMELPQDVCAAGRVQRFGISSEPSLTTAQTPFATGLSATGRLTSAAETPAFYGQPLVAWTPALGANIYEVQWSKTKYPFAAEVDPRSGAKGFLTFSTSTVLPLLPGTWYYRVRGIDYNLPTGVQQMAWSDPEQLVVTKPKLQIVLNPKPGKFKVIGGTTKKTPKK